MCRVHGGSAPQVRAKAQQRLLELVNPALAALARNIKPKAGESAQIAAAREILNRADLSLGVEDKSATAASVAIEEILEARKKRLREESGA